MTFSIPPGRILHGYDDSSEYASWCGTALHPACMWHMGSLMGERSLLSKVGLKSLQAALAKCKQTGMALNLGVDFLDGDVPKDQAVAEGKHVKECDDLHAALEESNVRVYVRPGVEQNHRDRYSKKWMPKAHRAFYERMEWIEVVWCVEPSALPVNDFFPGDEFIDVYGIDLYAPSTMNNANTREFMHMVTDTNKPWGVFESSFVGDKLAWVGKLAKLCQQRMPEVLTVISRDWRSGPNAAWGDCRIPTDKAFAPVWRSVLDPVFKPGVMVHRPEFKAMEGTP